MFNITNSERHAILTWGGLSFRFVDTVFHCLRGKPFPRSNNISVYFPSKRLSQLTGTIRTAIRVRPRYAEIGVRHCCEYFTNLRQRICLHTGKLCDTSIFYLRQGGYVLLCVCLTVCLPANFTRHISLNKEVQLNFGSHPDLNPDLGIF